MYRQILYITHMLNYFITLITVIHVSYDMRACDVHLLYGDAELQYCFIVFSLHFLLLRFTDEEEALHIANSSRHGLAGTYATSVPC